MTPDMAHRASAPAKVHRLRRATEVLLAPWVLKRRLPALAGGGLIVVSAKDDIDDRVAALDAGAQDYVVKPFALAELMARVRLRARSDPGASDGEESAATMLSHGRIALDRLRRVAEVEGEEVLLTPQEFALAEQFLIYPEEVLSRAELLERVWGLQQAPRRSNLVDVAVVSLRRRLGADTIETVRGEGYRFLG